MIAIVSGLPGSGKTLNAIKQYILPALKRGRSVYTNIDGLNKLAISINLDMSLVDIEANLRCQESTGETWAPTTAKIKALPAGCLIVIDEAQIYWNNRAYSSSENMELLPHLQKHRHYGQDIIFLTQNIDQLDVGIRRLTQAHYRLAKLVNAGLDKTVKVKVFPDAMGSEQFAPMSTIVWRIDKTIYPLYRSYNDNVQGEQKPIIGNVILKNPKFIFAVVVVIASIAVAYVSATKRKRGMFASSMIPSRYELPNDYISYYCAKEAVYVLKHDNTIDTVQTGRAQPAMCPSIGYHEVNQ